MRGVELPGRGEGKSMRLGLGSGNVKSFGRTRTDSGSDRRCSRGDVFFGGSEANETFLIGLGGVQGCCDS